MASVLDLVTRGIGPKPPAPPAAAPKGPTQGYTPDGNLKAPGYNNPDNPWDTGYTGRRNPEKAGGGKNTLSAWDYDKGAPKSGLGLDANGYYIIPGNGGSGGGGGGGGTYSTNIPGASQYSQAALLAKRAYDNAVASVTQRRQGTLTQYGYKGTVGANGQLTNFAIDPFNPYGQFQQLRRGNAQASQDLFAADVDRGIGSGGGLASQDQENLRYGEHAADAALGQGLGNDLAGYQGELSTAAYTRDAALYEAELAAAQAAIANGDFNPAGGGGDGGGDGVADPGTDGSAGTDNLEGLRRVLADPFGEANRLGINMFTGKPLAQKPVARNTYNTRFVPKPAPKPVAHNTYSTRFVPKPTPARRPPPKPPVRRK